MLKSFYLFICTLYFVFGVIFACKIRFVDIDCGQLTNFFVRMDIIKRKQTFLIKKIKKVDRKWLCYPKDEEEPIELNADFVYGKMPPVWKFPWQCHKLTISKIATFIKKAEMDGCILFDIAEKDFPPEVKKAIDLWRKKQEEYQLQQNMYNQSIKDSIADYLALIEDVENVEAEILKLPVCWRLYLKILWLKQYEHPELKRRVFLLFKLAQLANKLYLRHVNVSNRLDVMSKEMSFSSLWRLEFYGYDKFLFDFRAEQPKVKDEEDRLEIFLLFNEVNSVWAEFLPPVDDEKLMLYLNYAVREMLVAYSHDMSVLEYRRPRNLSGLPLSSDASAYSELVKKMTLPCFSSFIIEKPLLEAEIRRFAMNYSLE